MPAQERPDEALHELGTLPKSLPDTLITHGSQRDERRAYIIDEHARDQSTTELWKRLRRSIEDILRNVQHDRTEHPPIRGYHATPLDEPLPKLTLERYGETDGTEPSYLIAWPGLDMGAGLERTVVNGTARRLAEIQPDRTDLELRDVQRNGMVKKLTTRINNATIANAYTEAVVRNLSEEYG